MERPWPAIHGLRFAASSPNIRNNITLIFLPSKEAPPVTSLTILTGRWSG